MDTFGLKPTDEILQSFFEHFANHPHSAFQEEFETILKEYGMYDKPQKPQKTEQPQKAEQPKTQNQKAQKKNKSK